MGGGGKNQSKIKVLSPLAIVMTVKECNVQMPSLVEID